MYATVTVKQILDRKEYDVWSIDADAPVFDAFYFIQKVTARKPGIGVQYWVNRVAIGQWYRKYEGIPL